MDDAQRRTRVSVGVPLQSRKEGKNLLLVALSTSRGGDYSHILAKSQLQQHIARLSANVLIGYAG